MRIYKKTISDSVRNTFKIISLSALIFSQVISLTACGSSSSASDKTAADTSEEKVTLTVDFNNISGDIKPVNGINNGPKSQSSVTETEDGNTFSWKLDTSDYYEELDIPYVRTHDMEYPYGSDQFIDIHCIFPDFSQDPDNESAYNFSGTDEYVKNILSTGAQVYFRLGESISISTEEALYTGVPTDYDKWAEICDHIISHYNDGWNNGFQYDIKYWQIWNEPDMPRQWSGTLDEYYSLYQVTARYLKNNHPDIHIGAAAFSSADKENVQEFLDAITADGESTPLDFYAWHIYDSDPSKFDNRANVVRTVLDDNNYKDTEVFLDEWNYVKSWDDLEGTYEYIDSPNIAAFYAACLINIQNLPVDGAMYYDGTLTGDYAQWCGLYTADGEKLPGYNAFLAFAELKRLGNQVTIKEYDSLKSQGIYTMAASGTVNGTSTDAILIANNSDQNISLNLNTNSEKTSATLFNVNSDYPDGNTETRNGFSQEKTIAVKAHEMLLITLE